MSKEVVLKNLWKPTKGFLLTLALSVILLASGFYWFIQKEIYGDIITSLRNPGTGGVAWGLWIMFYIYIVGIAFSGITLSAIVRLFGMNELKPLTRSAELITILSVILGALCVLADQGRVFYALLNFSRYANPMSPMFGTFSIAISSCLFADLMCFYLSSRKDAFELSKYFENSKLKRLFYKVWAAGWRGDHSQEKRHEISSFWLAIFILPLVFIAYSTLGVLFGIQAGRPGWFSALQAPRYLVMAGISGIGLIIFVAYILRKIYRLEKIIGEKNFYSLGFVLFLLCIFYLYFTILEMLTALYVSPEENRYIAYQIIAGKFAPVFWISILLLILPAIFLFYQVITRKVNVALTTLSGIVVNISAILERFLFVVPSQTHGLYLPYQEGSYFPALSEIMVLFGVIGFGILSFVIFSKIFPVIPLKVFEEKKFEQEEKEEGLDISSPTRLLITFASIILGLSLAIIGFLYSLRFGTKYYLDPIIPFSPIIFILGVFIIFFSTVLYEILPSKKSKS